MGSPVWPCSSFVGTGLCSVVLSAVLREFTAILASTNILECEKDKDTVFPLNIWGKKPNIKPSSISSTMDNHQRNGQNAQVTRSQGRKCLTFWYYHNVQKMLGSTIKLHATSSREISMSSLPTQSVEQSPRGSTRIDFIFLGLIHAF